ncbi:uncharacterized protein J7T54_003441 [Emericellopsis cladophorae]|uniref:Uncharacterized protein n=1 Tax=Emericellopsis cladophorae TaxID=2686198 RepID=A0A9P9Y1Y6_9HYPO|nr:uncharacterized protein J7T54_003441 [Emericellopsis cladophorae]KAI6782022.1 hypothetical protein J7T54_003441 [Emericellopsis cladophorae]
MEDYAEQAALSGIGNQKQLAGLRGLNESRYKKLIQAYKVGQAATPQQVQPYAGPHAPQQQPMASGHQPHWQHRHNANWLNFRTQLSRLQPNKLLNPGRHKGSWRDRVNAGLERPNTIMSLKVNRTAFIRSKTRHSKRIRPKTAPITVRISKPIQLTLNAGTSRTIRWLTPGWTISYRRNPSLRFKEPSRYGSNRTCLFRDGMLFLVLQ